MIEKNIEVLRKILYAVETGGQVYGKQRYDAFIGAGAVVTKHVPDYALLVGNPARQLGWMSEYGHRLYFDAEGIAECPESHEKYQLKDGKVFKL